ncbi:MAG: alanine racemase, partial [Ignavibacterium sp.]|nr:alanine racemase [Ignavibacterium sp.]
MRESYALIDLNNLKQNYFNIRKKVKPAKILAVVKADAYGHGAVEVSKFLSELNPKPEYYGVALFDEAIQLRNSGIKEPILVFDVINSEKLSIAQEYSLDITISRNIDYEVLKKFFSKNKVYLNAHIKINTGMNRLGIRWDENLNEISKFYKIERVKINGIYTHFATSDIPKDKFAKTQLERFNKIIDKLKSLNIDLGIIHSANSGAILNM